MSTMEWTGQRLHALNLVCSLKIKENLDLSFHWQFVKKFPFPRRSGENVSNAHKGENKAKKTKNVEEEGSKEP